MIDAGPKTCGQYILNEGSMKPIDGPAKGLKNNSADAIVGLQVDGPSEATKRNGPRMEAIKLASKVGPNEATKRNGPGIEAKIGFRDWVD